ETPLPPVLRRAVRNTRPCRSTRPASTFVPPTSMPTHASWVTPGDSRGGPGVAVVLVEVPVVEVPVVEVPVVEIDVLDTRGRRRPGPRPASCAPGLIGDGGGEQGGGCAHQGGRRGGQVGTDLRAQFAHRVDRAAERAPG